MTSQWVRVSRKLAELAVKQQPWDDVMDKAELSPDWLVGDVSGSNLTSTQYWAGGTERSQNLGAAKRLFKPIFSH